MKKLFLIGLLCIMGCASKAIILKPFTTPQYGMSKKEMTDLLGTPESIEIYKRLDNTSVEFYMYERKYGDPHTMVPVCLINGKVAGWGKTYYEDHVTEDLTRVK